MCEQNFIFIKLYEGNDVSPYTEYKGIILNMQELLHTLKPGSHMPPTYL